MKRTLLFILAGILCCALFVSCAAPKYVHKDPQFSYEYPFGYKAEPVEIKNEVARQAAQNQYKNPVYIAQVMNREKGVKLMDVPKDYIKDLPELFPGAARFSFMEKPKSIKLSDGSDAITFTMKWRWTDKVTYLQSAAVMAYKGDKIIAVLGTGIYGGSSMDELMKHCMTLRLTSES